MVKKLIKFFCTFFIVLNSNQILADSNDITLSELVLGDKKSFHLRLLKAIPESGKIDIGPKNAENTIIEFFDYKCGYCTKMHPELVEIVNERNDTRVIFLQLPILSEFSAKLARLVLAANYQDKGFDLHHAILTQKGSITEEKIINIMNEIKINSEKISKDLERKEIEDALHITSFIASAIGVRGTPAVFINSDFNPGYVPKNIIEELLY